MESALLNYDGEMGNVLHTVINYENGNWDCEQKILIVGGKKMKSDDITQAYLDSVQWAEKNKQM
jgi:c-di-GMP-related signal transduction protein